MKLKDILEIETAIDVLQRMKVVVEKKGDINFEEEIDHLDTSITLCTDMLKPFMSPNPARNEESLQSERERV